MSIDIGFLVCSNTTTKTYLQRAKNTFRSVLDSLCLEPHQESHGLMSQGFSLLPFVLRYLLFPIPLSFNSKFRFMLASIENTEHHAKQLSIAVWRDQVEQWNKREKKILCLKITGFSKNICHKPAVFEVRQRQKVKYMPTKHVICLHNYKLREGFK